MVARSAIGSVILLSGMAWSAGVFPGARTAAASALGYVSSFGAHNATASASLSAYPRTATTTGNLLVAVIRDRNTTALAPVVSVTNPVNSTSTNKWTFATSTHGTTGDEEIWYAAGAASLSTSQAVKVTVGGTSAATSAIAFTVLEVTGASASPLDVFATKSGTTQPASTGITAPTTQPSEIAIADIGWTGSVTLGTPATAGYATNPPAVEQSTVSGSAAGE